MKVSFTVGSSSETNSKHWVFALAVAAAALFAGCGDSAPEKRSTSGEASPQRAEPEKPDRVIVFDVDKSRWTELAGLSDARGRRIQKLDATSYLAGFVKADGTLMVARDASSARENPIFDIAFNYTGDFIYGDLPTWNETGERAANNSANGSLQVFDKVGKYADQLVLGTYKGLTSGSSGPTSMSDLEFDSWVTSDEILVHGTNGGSYGPFVGTFNGDALDLQELNGINPNDYFFSGRDGYYVQIDGSVGQMDMKLGQLVPKGRIRPKPNMSDLTASVQWSPDGKSFVLDGQMNIAGGTTVCNVADEVSCKSIDLPGDRREGFTSYVWTPDNKSVVVNTVFSGEGAAVRIVDATTGSSTPLAFDCESCSVVGFM